MKNQALLACVVLTLNAGAIRADENEGPPILREVGLRQNPGAQVPLDLQFRDENGQAVTLADCTEGKTTILVLGYFRCPKLCTQVLSDLASGLGAVPWNVGREYSVVTVSFDDRDTPEMAAAKKQSYIEHFALPGMETGWHFLTGEKAPILRLANTVGFQFRYDPKNDLFAHPTCVIILTPEGRVARYFIALRDPSDPGTFARDLRLGLVEASEYKIGMPVIDRALLFCYRYDPETGKYTMAVMNLVRGAGALTMVVLSAVLWLAWRRERRNDVPLVTVTGMVKPVTGASG
jgi:protein SCO1/2